MHLSQRAIGTLPQAFRFGLTGAIVLVLVVGCGDGRPAVDTTGTATARFSEGMESLQGGIERGMPATVTLVDGLRFEPASVTVPAGSTVVWRNASADLHTITVVPTQTTVPGTVQIPAGAEPFESERLSQGQTYVRPLTVAGEYRYVCRIHEGSGMAGVITVE